MHRDPNRRGLTPAEQQRNQRALRTAQRLQSARDAERRDLVRLMTERRSVCG